MPLRIAHFSSEFSPLAKVGGLGDVVAALSAEQARRGHSVVVALPGYAAARCPADWHREALGGCEVPWAMGKEPARFEVAREPDIGRRLLFVHHDGERKFFERAGIYNEPSGEAWPDNAERFLFFNRAAMEGLERMDGALDILHAHDHQTAWAPCFVRTHAANHPTFRDTATVFTIHNLGYQGLYDPWVLALAGFPPSQFFPGSPFEFWGRVNFMKVGLSFADMLSTVSPRYAKEIQSSGEFGFGLEGLLARRGGELRGILNGIDDHEWNPETDPLIPAHYSAEQLDGKRQCRAALALRCGFPPDPPRPIVGMVSRLVEQKGFDLVEEAAYELLELDARFVVLGTGQPRYQDLMQRLAKHYPERFAWRGEFDETFAHMVEAGSDLFLMPSRYEPCGLNQMYSQRYGTPPVVRATGGLADTVEEFDVISKRGTGFRFDDYEAGAMMGALRRGLAIRKQPELWGALIRNGMEKDFSWRRSAAGYERLYEEARERVKAGRTVTLDTARSPI